MHQMVLLETLLSDQGPWRLPELLTAAYIVASCRTRYSLLLMPCLGAYCLCSDYALPLLQRTATNWGLDARRQQMDTNKNVTCFLEGSKSKCHQSTYIDPKVSRWQPTSRLKHIQCTYMDPLDFLNPSPKCSDGPFGVQRNLPKVPCNNMVDTWA